MENVSPDRQLGGGTGDAQEVLERATCRSRTGDKT
jgi:hypothetical protein